jgi:hypothetical protein
VHHNRIPVCRKAADRRGVHDRSGTGVLARQSPSGKGDILNPVRHGFCRVTVGFAGGKKIHKFLYFLLAPGVFLA